MSLQQSAIYFGPSELHGKGVFAARQIEAGEVIEVCPILLFPRSELEFMDKTVLYDYYFDWGDDGKWFAVCLGYGSLYNHSYEPNAEYEMDFEADTIDFLAIRTIEPGDEICVNYNGDAECRTPVWFEKDGAKRG